MQWRHVTCNSLFSYSVCDLDLHFILLNDIKGLFAHNRQFVEVGRLSSAQRQEYGFSLLSRQFAVQANIFFAQLIGLMSSCASSADGRESTGEGCLPLSHQSGPCQACKALQNNQMCLVWKGPRNTRVFIFCGLHNSGSQPCVITPILREKPY